ncbi:hypothetical protein ACJ6WF_16855 [Streptomyces sp. MMS24-I2-30]|uniref:hypothetical protein n=1 Tax=Streptomyces sp. MMS24-I2-30 TaxID=3351564 RepID=UPI003896A681
MPDPPAPLPLRRDTSAADVGSLVRLGWTDPPPIPAPVIQPFQEPVYDPLPPLDDEPA